jgi:hypothetical protein
LKRDDEIKKSKGVRDEACCRERERERESSTHSERGRGQIDGREQGESKMVTLVKETSAIFVLTKNGMASKSQPNTPQTPFSQ